MARPPSQQVLQFDLAFWYASLIEDCCVREVIILCTCSKAETCTLGEVDRPAWQRNAVEYCNVLAVYGRIENAQGAGVSNVREC